MKRKPPIDKDGKVVAVPGKVEPQLHLKRFTRDGVVHQVEIVNETREYELITPLFGGGTETQKADPISVIRVPSIRGQLRFWWRACRAAQFADIAEMKRVEDLIWGSTEKPSAVIVDLEIVSRGNEETAYWTEWNSVKSKVEVKNSAMIAPYAAFPLQPEKDEQQKRDWKSEAVVLNVGFKVSLRFPLKIEAVEKNNGEERSIKIDNVGDHVASALWAWESFGGLGARTRRGFGALNVVRVNNQSASAWPADGAKLRSRLQAELLTHVAEGRKHWGVPQLSRRASFAFTGVKALSSDYEIRKRTRANAITAWKSLIEQLQGFRQARYGDKFGKSKWPEANEIRHRADLPLRIADEAEGRQLVHKFPRAVFGLPIIFHLPHDPGKPDFHLIGKPLKDDAPEKTVERLASRLILRPLACEGGKAVGLALVLETESVPPKGLLLKGNTRTAENDPQPDVKLEEPEARLIDPLKKNSDVLQAFLDRLK